MIGSIADYRMITTLIIMLNIIIEETINAKDK